MQAPLDALGVIFFSLQVVGHAVSACRPHQWRRQCSTRRIGARDTAFDRTLHSTATHITACCVLRVRLANQVCLLDVLSQPKV